MAELLNHKGMKERNQKAGVKKPSGFFAELVLSGKSRSFVAALLRMTPKGSE
jgi:hypothetical protein